MQTFEVLQITGLFIISPCLGNELGNIAKVQLGSGQVGEVKSCLAPSLLSCPLNTMALSHHSVLDSPAGLPGLEEESSLLVS